MPRVAVAKVGTFAPTGREAALLASIAMEYWRPVYGHPAWPSTTPSLRVVDRFAYPAGEDADGTRMEPWYRLSAGLVYRADGHPDGASSTAELKVVGNFIYPIAGPDRGPWFQIADRT